MAKVSEINFQIHLDDQHVPDKIMWTAADKATPGYEEAKAISLALWDHNQQSTLKIDLWAKDMPVLDMKRFYLESIGGIAESLKNATGDTNMVNAINELCEKLGKYLEQQSKM